MATFQLFSQSGRAKDLPAPLYTAVSLQRLVTYILPLNSVFFHETNSFYCVTGYVSVEN